jgi:heme O synthase-like polyprenyltransferase
MLPLKSSTQARGLPAEAMSPDFALAFAAFASCLAFSFGLYATAFAAGCPAAPQPSLPAFPYIVRSCG